MIQKVWGQLVLPGPFLSIHTKKPRRIDPISLPSFDVFNVVLPYIWLHTTYTPHKLQSLFFFCFFLNYPTFPVPHRARRYWRVIYELLLFLFSYYIIIIIFVFFLSSSITPTCIIKNIIIISFSLVEAILFHFWYGKKRESSTVAIVISIRVSWFLFVVLFVVFFHHQTETRLYKRTKNKRNLKQDDGIHFKIYLSAVQDIIQYSEHDLIVVIDPNIYPTKKKK